MKIMNSEGRAFRLTTKTLTELHRTGPYRMQLIDLDPKRAFSAVPYEITRYRSILGLDQPTQLFTANVTIHRVGKRVTRLEIGCQDFVNADARAILKAAKAARARAAAKKKTK